MNTMINALKGNKIHKVWVGGLRTTNNLTKQLGQTVRNRCIPSKLSLHSQWNKSREALYKVINWKANHSIRGKHHGTDRVKQNSGQSMKALELPWLENVSWASHFGNIFMESSWSVMADILNRSNFYFTFSYNLRILWLLFVCMFDKLNRFL